MDFGRIPNIDQVNFKLPDDHPDNKAVLGSSLHKNAGIYIGAPIWAEKSWLGSVFPKGTREKDFLYHYSRYFNCIELNTTHYRIPEPETVRIWKEVTPASFRFCPKVPQLISHSTQISTMHEMMDYFSERISGLEERMGIVFLQLPPYLGVNNTGQLVEFLNKIKKTNPLAIELRHETWFTGNPEAERFFRYLRDRKITLVISDVAGRRDVLHMRLTTPKTIIRFNGHNGHPTDLSRLDEWAEKIKKWQACGLQELFFFMHSPDRSLCPSMTEYLNKQLGILPPQFPDDRVPRQGSLF